MDVRSKLSRCGVDMEEVMEVLKRGSGIPETFSPRTSKHDPQKIVRLHPWSSEYILNDFPEFCNTFWGDVVVDAAFPVIGLVI